MSTPRVSSVTSGISSSGCSKRVWSASMRRAPRKLERWRTLAAPERWLLVRAAMLLPVTTALLFVVGFGWTRRIIAGSNTPVTVGEIDPHGISKAERIGWLVDVAARHGPVAARCLPRSLVLCRLLRQH